MYSRTCDRRTFLAALGAGAATLALPARGDELPARKPNFVVILTDDQGYGDVGCFGAEGFETPHLDRMAAEGMRLMDFYSAAPVCTPSRAALMTGCYPLRVGLPDVLFPQSKIGLNPEEITIAEILKAQGYATGCFGKWHLGHHPEFLPMRHGFDEYFGLPYSNDMIPSPERPPGYPELPLIDGEEAIETNPDQTQLTTRYTERAVQFIERHKDEPFFVYLPHSMPHVPLFVSDKFAGKSRQGLYGDVIMEIDWSVGRILDTLKRLDLDEHTLVFFSSDNGPWLIYGDHAGSAGRLREGKTTTFDGGQRVPGIARWPGRIPAGSVCREVAAMFDLLPTFAHLAGSAPPADRVIDGRIIWPLLSGRLGVQSPHDTFYFFRSDELQAVRAGRWKLHLPHTYNRIETPGTGGKPGKYAQGTIESALFYLPDDPGETRDFAAAQPKVVERLTAMAHAFEQDLIADARPPGVLAEPE
ncbi:MAG TPA: sulfatase [Candidatus Hydrogenedentes bacterium]|nr:sulfatase [Candidatus Hydrogenedentota bacterium]